MSQANANAESTTATEPRWYKQFWPWFLIALPTAAVIASFISLDISIKHADTPIEDGYIKHGLTVVHKSALKTDTSAGDARPQQ